MEKTIELKSGKSRLRVNSAGSMIEELTLGGNLVLAQVKRSDGKTISSHPCTPIFRYETKTDYGLAQHGNARNLSWEISEKTEDSVTLTIAVREGKYPLGLTVRQKFKVGKNGFSLQTEHFNGSNVLVPVNFAEHLYWNSPFGWQQGIKVNNKNIVGMISAETGLMNLKKENKVEIPGTPEMRLIQKGLALASLWSAKRKDGKTDNHYFCLEPQEFAFEEFGTKATMIAPKEKRVTLIAIELV